ncbi:MAG: hypothetical protein IJ072_02125 [Oscillospiraceae bacterium]|nr:hypothetical protein [Oscillospiraceae bacterium]
MKDKKSLLCVIGAAVAFAATVAAIVIFWEEITFFFSSVREKIVRVLDSVSQRTYIDHYDEYEEYSDYIDN